MTIGRPRKPPDYKQYGFVLSDKTRKKLEHCAEISGLTMSQIIEQAIEQLTEFRAVVTEERTITINKEFE